MDHDYFKMLHNSNFSLFGYSIVYFPVAA